MSAFDYNTLFSLGSTRVIIPIGATLAVLFQPIAGQIVTQVKYSSGGTLELIAVTQGTTLSAAQLNTATGNHYIVGNTEVLSFGGPAWFYLSATGATVVVNTLRGFAAPDGTKSGNPN